MIFDRLCGIAERHVAEFIPMLHEAHVFEFPGSSKDVMRLMDQETAADLASLFFLPYPVTAVEDKESCVVLVDLEPNQEGFAKRRAFVECLPLDQYDDITVQSGVEGQPKVTFKSTDFPRDACMIRCGSFDQYSIDKTQVEAGTAISGMVRWWAVMSMKDIEIPARTLTENDQIHLRDALNHVSAAIEEVLYFNQPARFIVEKAPLRARHKQQEKRILRSNDRPTYTTLTPGEIREQLKLEIPATLGKKAKASHERRRHVRTLRSDFFKEKKGSSIIIPAMWIGPDEAVKNGHRYKVIIDR